MWIDEKYKRILNILKKDWRNSMKVVLLAGGFGTRISEESQFKPKPMIEIGGKPILWHIMKEYEYYGFNEFIICAGYKQYVIKEWFADYFLHNSDITFDFTKGSNDMIIHEQHCEPWKVTVVDTGLNTMTGGRIKRVQKYVGNEPFLMTYGDGVCDVDISKLVEFHKEHGKIATLTSVMLEQQKGVLDIGGDKDIPYMGLTKELNPFLGYRAIRFCLDRVDIFTTQLRAVLRASAYGNIRIMIPMITSVTEVQAVKKIINGICRDLDKKDIKYDKDIKIGVMIETPAAAIMADVLAHEVDFFSIGTNDLTQYTLAVDRGNENVAYLYSALNPAVIRSIKHIIECAHNAGIEAGMCGEAAADERMIPLLLNFGLDEFSVTVSRVLETRKEIASWSSKEVKEITENVMNYSEEKEVSNYLSDCIAKE